MGTPAIAHFPDQLERLAEWRRRRAKTAAERERRPVAEVLFRRDLGQELTEQDRAVLAYSVYGTGQGCGCR